MDEVLRAAGGAGHQPQSRNAAAGQLQELIDESFTHEGRIDFFVDNAIDTSAACADGPRPGRLAGHVRLNSNRSSAPAGLVPAAALVPMNSTLSRRTSV